MPDTFPAVVVEAAWGTDPADPTPVWFELAGWRTITITSGRQRELDTFSPGTLTVVCSDRDRQLDPTNAAATHAGNLLPMRRIRVVATFDAVAYPLFYGYIDAFEHAYAGPHHGDVTATITATDGFKVLEAADLAPSAYAAEVEADAPVAWWRLGEPAGSTTLSDVVGSKTMTVVGTPLLGADGLVSRDADSAMEIVDVNTDGAELAGGAIAQKPLTVEFLIRVDPASPAGLVVYQADAAQTNGFSFQIDASGQVIFGVGTNTQTTQFVTSTVAIDDDAPHHVAGTWTSGGLATLYVDGTSTGTPVTRTGSMDTAAAFAVGALPNLVGGGSQDSFLGVIDEVAVYDTALSAARVAAHHTARATPWAGDTPKARIDRVLDAEGWPAALRDLDVGTVTLSSAELGGSALEHVQRVAASDFGAVFMSTDGKVTFIGRDALWNRPSEGVFGDDPATPAELGYRTIRPEYTDALIRNDVTVSRAEGTAQRASDATSIAKYLRHSFTVDGLIHNSDVFSLDAAMFLVSEYKNPRRRISGMAITPPGDPTDLFPQVLGRGLLDVVTLWDRPAGGTANTQTSAIEGITHEIGPKWWDTTWNLTPAFGSGAGTDHILTLDDTSGPGLDLERLAF
jgi:hypothetical protein